MAAAVPPPPDDQAAGPAPLAGVRVLDLCDGLGELGTRYLADLGADVIRVEPPGGGASRGLAPCVDGVSLRYVTHNAGKRALVQLRCLQLAEIDHPRFGGRFDRETREVDPLGSDVQNRAIRGGDYFGGRAQDRVRIVNEIDGPIQRPLDGLLLHETANASAVGYRSIDFTFDISTDSAPAFRGSAGRGILHDALDANQPGKSGFAGGTSRPG